MELYSVAFHFYSPGKEGVELLLKLFRSVAVVLYHYEAEMIYQWLCTEGKGKSGQNMWRYR